ncbi:MAG TPA: hypothetical protein VFA46_10885 [Actinomycetes bacterium]|nr:hypothetical protein [Actinomycetes bacterium]
MRRVQAMTDFFYDDDQGWAEWVEFRREAHRVEQQHLDLRTVLRDAEAALRADPEREELRAQVDELKARLADLERQSPWLTLPHPVEVLLWGVSHG